MAELIGAGGLTNQFSVISVQQSVKLTADS
jgi:hypothetical protein